MSSSSQLPPALGQAIQHPAICNDQQAIALLLCTSKQLASAISARCGGLVSITIQLHSLQQALALAQWLAAHGSLIRSLDIGPYDPSIQIGRRRDKATEAIAKALAQAACSPQGLMLHQVVLNEVSNNPTLLENLAYSTQLTGLTLLLPRYETAGDPAQDLLPALAGLRSLRSLLLYTKWHYTTTNTDCLLPALQHLSNLSLLTIGEPQKLARLCQLPVQLQRLEVITVRENRYFGYPGRPPLQLAHLTALRVIAICRPSSLAQPCRHSYSQPLGTWRPSFRILEKPAHSSLCLQEGDQLPPALTDLTVESLGKGLAPQLQHLRRLVLTSSGTPAAALQEIARHCDQLTSLQLTLNDEGLLELHSTAAVLPVLPVTDLHLELCRGADTNLQQLAATRKTLTLLAFDSCVRDDAEVVAAVVQELTGLRQLRIRLTVKQDRDSEHALTDEPDTINDNWNLPPEAVPEVTGEDSISADRELLAVVATLQQLRCFSLSLGCWASAQQVLSGLTAATQLTALQLRHCGLEDKTVIMLSAKLTGLRELDISENSLIHGRSLSAIGNGLQQLTYLNVCETNLNEVDMSSLTQLSVLRMGPLHLRGTMWTRSWMDTVMDLDE